MVTRDDRRAVAVANRRPRGRARTVIRRGVGPEVLPEPVEPVEAGAQAPGQAPPRRRPARTRIQRTRPRRTRAETVSPRARWAVRLLAVALLGALTAAGVFGRQWYDQRQLDTARQQALAGARQETVDFVSVSTATIDQDLKRIADGATGEFRDEFTRDMAQVRAAVMKNKVRSKGTVLRAAVVSSDARKAVVLVALDATVQNTSAPEGQLSHYRIQVSLSRDAGSGRWLVSQLQFVG